MVLKITVTRLTGLKHYLIKRTSTLIDISIKKGKYMNLYGWFDKSGNFIIDDIVLPRDIFRYTNYIALRNILFDYLQDIYKNSKSPSLNNTVVAQRNPDGVQIKKQFEDYRRIIIKLLEEDPENKDYILVRNTLDYILNNFVVKYSRSKQNINEAFLSIVPTLERQPPTTTITTTTEEADVLNIACLDQQVSYIISNYQTYNEADQNKIQDVINNNKEDIINYTTYIRDNLDYDEGSNIDIIYSNLQLINNVIKTKKQDKIFQKLEISTQERISAKKTEKSKLKDEKVNSRRILRLNDEKIKGFDNQLNEPTRSAQLLSKGAAIERITVKTEELNNTEQKVKDVTDELTSIEESTTNIVEDVTAALSVEQIRANKLEKKLKNLKIKLTVKTEKINEYENNRKQLYEELQRYNLQKLELERDVELLKNKENYNYEKLENEIRRILNVIEKLEGLIEKLKVERDNLEALNTEYVKTLSELYKEIERLNAIIFESSDIVRMQQLRSELEVLELERDEILNILTLLNEGYEYIYGPNSKSEEDLSRINGILFDALINGYSTEDIIRFIEEESPIIEQRERPISNIVGNALSTILGIAAKGVNPYTIPFNRISDINYINDIEDRHNSGKNVLSVKDYEELQKLKNNITGKDNRDQNIRQNNNLNQNIPQNENVQNNEIPYEDRITYNEDGESVTERIYPITEQTKTQLLRRYLSNSLYMASPEISLLLFSYAIELSVYTAAAMFNTLNFENTPISRLIDIICERTYKSPKYVENVINEVKENDISIDPTQMQSSPTDPPFFSVANAIDWLGKNVSKLFTWLMTGIFTFIKWLLEKGWQIISAVASSGITGLFYILIVFLSIIIAAPNKNLVRNDIISD